MFLTSPDHNPPFPHTVSRVYFLPVVHRPKNPEQQNLCPSRNLFLPRNRGAGKKAQYNVELSFSTFRAYSQSQLLHIWMSRLHPRCTGSMEHITADY